MDVMEGNATDYPVFYNKVKSLDLALTFAMTILSIIGAILLVLCHFVRFGCKLSRVRQYLIFLTCADFINATGQLMGAISYISSNESTLEKGLACHIVNDDKCIAQSFVTTYSSMASFFWTIVIAYHLYITYSQKDQANCVNYWYHFISWGIPLAIVITATAKRVLGSDLSVGSGAWCWISACLSPIERTVWMTISGKGWEVLMYIFCMAFYILIKWEKFKRVQRRKRNPQVSSFTPSVQQNKDEEDKPEDLRFLLLWLVEVALRAAGTIRFLVAVAKRHSGSVSDRYDKADKVLLGFQSFGDSGQALCSFLIFCVFDKEMREILKSIILCRCKVDSESSELKPLVSKNQINTEYQDSII